MALLRYAMKYIIDTFTPFPTLLPIVDDNANRHKRSKHLGLADRQAQSALTIVKAISHLTDPCLWQNPWGRP